MRAPNKNTLLLLGLLAGCGQQLVQFPNPVPPTVPSVTSTDPANNSTGIGVSRTVNATFSELMDQLTITATTFTLKQGATSIPGSVRYAGLTATFEPTDALSSGLAYTATVSTGARSAASETGLAADFTWTFTTETVGPVATPPTVTATSPVNNATGVMTTQQVTASFIRAMDPTTIDTTTFTLWDLRNATMPLAGIVSYTGTTATFVPANPLTDHTTYTATITTGAKDAAGVGLAEDYTWSFVTAALAPTVTTNPKDAQMGVCIPVQVVATFSAAMDPLTINTQTFTLSSPGPTPVGGVVTYDPILRAATFAPSMDLLGSTTYAATITTGAKDETGTPLMSAKTWSFTTSTKPCLLPVNLRSLASFVAVAGAGLTNSNTQLPAVTTLNGDVGLSPTATCMSDGSPCNPPAGAPKINGNLYANDPAGKAAAAKADLVSAYNDAQGRPPGTVITANLAGQVLAPGVYTSQPASSMDLAVNGILTLDAQGDQNGVWIFQIGSTLTANNGSQVLLVNGARAANVFWALASSSTIGTNVQFKGTVLAQESNSVQTGSTVEGRLVCTTGAITLLSNVITLPSP